MVKQQILELEILNSNITRNGLGEIEGKGMTLSILCSLNTDGTKTEKDTFNNKKCEGSKEK